MQHENSEVQTTIGRYPKEFGLRGFRGDTFRIRERGCYHNGTAVQIVVEVNRDGEWLDFWRGDAAELDREIIKRSTK